MIKEKVLLKEMHKEIFKEWQKLGIEIFFKIIVILLCTINNGDAKVSTGLEVIGSMPGWRCERSTHRLDGNRNYALAA